jgi:hypothetical protein
VRPGYRVGDRRMRRHEWVTTSVVTAVALGMLTFGWLGDRVANAQTVRGTTSAPSCTYTSQLGRQYHSIQFGNAVGVAVSANGMGYWIGTDVGDTFTCNMPTVWGSWISGQQSPPPVVAVAAPSSGGIFLARSDGEVAAFGTAVPHGSIPAGTTLAKPIVGIAVDAATGGYWLAAADGGVFSFDAPFYGSMGGQRLDAPIAGITAMPDGGGYRLVAADGGIFDFGDATFGGSAA